MMKYNRSLFLVTLLCLGLPLELFSIGQYNSQFRSNAGSYGSTGQYGSGYDNASYQPISYAPRAMGEQGKAMMAEYETLNRTIDQNDPAQLITFIEAWSIKQQVLNSAGKSAYQRLVNQVRTKIENDHNLERRENEAEARRIDSLASRVEPLEVYGQRYGSYNDYSGYEYGQYGDSATYYNPGVSGVYDPTGFGVAPGSFVGEYRAGMTHGLGGQGLKQNLLKPGEKLPTVNELSLKDVETKIGAARRNIDLIKTGIKQGLTSSSRANRIAWFLAAMSALEKAIRSANKIRKYSDTSKYYEAADFLYLHGMKKISDSKKDRSLIIKQKLIGKMLTLMVDAGGKLDLESGWLGIEDQGAIKKYAEVAGLLNDKDAKYLISDLMIIQKDWKSFSALQKQAEEIAKVVFGRGLDTILRKIALNDDEVSESDERKSFILALQDLVKYVDHKVFTNPYGQVVTKPFKSDEVTRIAAILYKAVDRLNDRISNKITGWNDPVLYDHFLHTVSVIFGRADLMIAMRQKENEKYKKILDFLSTSEDYAISGKDAKAFFNGFEKIYDSILGSEASKKLTTIREQFDAHAGVGLSELIEVGRLVWPKRDSKEDAGPFLIGIGLLARVVAELSFDLQVNELFKSHTNSLSMIQTINGENVTVIKVDGKNYADLPIQKEFGQLIGVLLQRCHQRLDLENRFDTNTFSVKNVRSVYEDTLKLLNLVFGMILGKPGTDFSKTLQSGLQLFAGSYLTQDHQDDLATRQSSVKDALKLSLSENLFYQLSDVVAFFSKAPKKSVPVTEKTVSAQSVSTAKKSSSNTGR